MRHRWHRRSRKPVRRRLDLTFWITLLSLAATVIGLALRVL